MQIILGLLCWIIDYFILKRKGKKIYAKYVLLIGFIVSIACIVGIINLGMSTEPDHYSESDYTKELNEIENNEPIKHTEKQFSNIDNEIQAMKKEIENNEPIKHTEKQFSNIDNEIQAMKKEIDVYKKHQLDVWPLLSELRPDRTKEETVQDRISRLEYVIEADSEELEYLIEDLFSATSEFESRIIQSLIKYYISLISYDKEKLTSLKNNGIDAFEKYQQNEAQKQINKYLEKIQRLENLKSKNLNYLNTDEQVFQYISNYKGIDNKGNTLQTEVESFIKEKYGHDALTDNNPFFKDNWIKTNTIFYFGTEYADDFSRSQGRYTGVTYAFFGTLYGEYKTILGFGFDTETYNIMADNQDSVEILKKLDNG